MKVLRPVDVTSIYASDIAEPDTGESAWNSGTTYAAGNEVYLSSTHRKYRSVQGSNLNHDPATDDGTWWLDIGGTNKWAMFDEYVSTYSQRTSATSFAVTINTGIIDSLFLYGMEGEEAEVVMRDGAGGTIVYSTTLTLQVPKINDWYAYYFEAYRYVPYFVITDLPPYANAHVTLTITSASAMTLKCGMMVPSRSYEIGSTQYGVRAGIRDYSRKTVDEATGFVTLEQRKYAKTLRATVRTDQLKFPEVHAMLEDLRATPVVWIGDSNGLMEPLTVFGFYKDFYLTVDLPSCGLYTLEVEGMV